MLLPYVATIQRAFPSLQNLTISLSDGLSGEIPLGLVEDMSDVMRISDYDYPIDTGGRAQVHGMMLRWLSKTRGGELLVLDLWKTYQRLRRKGGVGLNVSIEFGVEFGQCVALHEHTSLFRLAKDRDSLWWRRTGHILNHEDIPANLENEGEDENSDEDAYLDILTPEEWTELSNRLHAERPGRKKCDWESCLPSMAVDPRWNVQCVFEARSWTWTINVADHWWKCGELDGEADLKKSGCREPNRNVVARDQDLLTAPKRRRASWYHPTQPSEDFQRNNQL